MDDEPGPLLATALLILLEATLYLINCQLYKKNRRRNDFFFVLLMLHLSQRRLLFNAFDYPSVFGWAVIRSHTPCQSEEPETPAGGTSPTSIEETIVPPRNIPPHPLNVSNAVRLHNQLVEHVLSRAPHLTPRVHKDWFSLHSHPDYGSSSSDILPRLTPPIIEFLANIYAWDDLDSFSLTPHVRGVAWPDFVSPSPDSDEGELFYLTFPDCIVLYHSDIADSEARGLVLDQRTFLARFLLSIWDDGTGGSWAPLEDILASWVAEAECGRWTIDPLQEGDMHGPPTAWKHQNWLESDVDQIVLFWEAYLGLVAAKRGLPVRATEPLASPALLDQAGVKGFEYALLSRLRRPDFAFVAPGLRVPDEAMFASTLAEASRRREEVEADAEGNDNIYDRFAVLLFYADVRVSEGTYLPRDERYTAAYWRENFVQKDLCGVYLGTWHAADNADAVSVVAPRTDGNASNVLFVHYQRLVNATLLSLPRESLAEAAGLYQHFRLYHMIARWYDLVVTGKWTVGPDGVQGDVEHVWDMLPDDWQYNY